jgi:group I intron endonuclease
VEIVTGIYGIYNWVNGKWYVGQSVDIQRRKAQERCYLRAGKLHSKQGNEQIAIEWAVYGPEAFVWVVLEECSVEELNDREIYWIAKKDSYKNGYNQTTGGGTGRQGRPRKGG